MQPQYGQPQYGQQPQYGETQPQGGAMYGDVPPGGAQPQQWQGQPMAQPMAQPMYVQPQGTQIQCGNCKGLMQIPPTCPPGSHVACPQCGTTLQVPGAVTMAVTVTTPVNRSPEEIARKDQKKSDRQEEETALIFFVAGFFFCCPWFAGLLYWNSQSERARLWARCSLIALAVTTCCILLPVIIAVSIAPAAANTCYNNACYYTSYYG